MPSLSPAVCLKCEEIYDSTTRKICSGTLCSHSICEPCFDQKKYSTCPTCGKPDSFANKSINYQAMELLDRLKEDMSLKVIAEGISEVESLSRGPCCECNKYCNNLRLCVSCSLESNLLVKLENGDIKMTTETNGELLETKILRLRSSAFCANCVLDKKLHKEHSTILVKDVKGLANNTKISNALSVVALSMNQIKEKTEVFSRNRKLNIRLAEYGNQLFECVITYMANILEADSNTPIDKNAGLYLKFFLQLCGTLRNIKISKYSQVQFNNRMEAAEAPEEKMAMKKMSELSGKLWDLLTTANDLSQLEPADFQHIIDVLKSGQSRPFFEVLKLNTKDILTEEKLQELVTISNDIKRTIPFKVPPQYEKYVNVAEMCIKAFIG
ncbi:hypothetical protein B9Z55_013015 [Caenorhabditis nigoni]|uniref:RING-type domain-containing protein n=1 Tax=Caenorhabditis nigoni TaxID=1611254 RepID=A0A2G5TZU6_9PELO|nr:hypothetical protein B9Z55_013015 [Caenorhabditis nigoni]